MNPRPLIICLCVGFAACLVSVSGMLMADNGSPTAPPVKTAFSVTGMMTDAQQKACGLAKLTQEERSRLDDFLLTKMAEILERRTATPDLVQSSIHGEFHGWDGDTVFVLTNGQIWQQAEPSIYVGIAVMPQVIIYKGSGGVYKMRVEDVENTLEVKRLK